MSPAMRDFGQKLIEIIGGSSLGGEFMPREQLMKACREFEVALTSKANADVAFYKDHADRVEESCRRSLSELMAREGKARHELAQCLLRCLNEAESALYEEHGCKPGQVMGYDGWADRARELLAREGVS